MVIRNSQSNQSWKISDDSVMYWDNYGNIKYQNLEPNELFRLPKKGSMTPDDQSNFIQVRMGGGVIRWMNRNLKPKSPKPNTKAQELIKQKKKGGKAVLKRDLDYNNEFFRKLIKGKRVIYVGPAATLEGKEMGEFIDSFDVVIRSNNSYQIPDESQVDYGSRCDILYASGVFRKQNIINSENTEHIKLVCSNRKFHSVIDKCRVFRMDRIKNQKRFLTGIYSLIDILNQNPRELYITGMDFYQSEKMYTDFYKIGDLHTADNAKKTLNTYHDVDKDLEYFKKHIAFKPNVTLDETLNAIMNSKKHVKSYNNEFLNVNDYFKNKRVILVGPAPTVKEMRDLINTYDIIVRLNDSFITDGIENDISTKTHVLYLNGHRSRKLYNDDKYYHKIKEKGYGVELIITKIRVAGNNSIMVKRNDIKLKYRNDKYFAQSSEGKGLNLATLAILDLLTYDIESLRVIGITFYSKEVPYYNKNHTKNIDDLDKKIEECDPNTNKHPQLPQRKLLKTVLRNDKRLSFDELSLKYLLE